MKFFISIIILLLPISVFAADPAPASPPKPKYGSMATLLSQSHEFIQKHEAPDYWVLSPYYLPQQDDKSCSVASVAMVMNAARSGKKLTADDELVTQSGLLKKVGDKKWLDAVGANGTGVSLDELGTLIEKSLKSYGFEKAIVKVIHTEDQSADSKKKLHEDLLENEKSNKNFIILNFIQGAYTGDADVGHIAPIAAYDAAKGRALVFDPDRQWYEPYWVSEETLLSGMATKDKTSSHFRGYVKVKIEK
jgi:hypothetical protein